MTKFKFAQIVSIAMSAALALSTWFATVTVPAQPSFAAAAAAVELA